MAGSFNVRGDRLPGSLGIYAVIGRQHDKNAAFRPKRITLEAGIPPSGS
jgi:hypothetical protein